MDELARWADTFGLELTAAQLAQFHLYESLLLEWNERIALTAIRESREIRIRHFLDSLTCAIATGDLTDCSLVDVGSGAGFPGLPLKIFYPGLRLTMVESVEKKTRFLELAAEQLGLKDVTILTERTETVGHNPDYREKFDWATARAVAELRTLVELLLPLVRVGGHMLAQKGESAAEEASTAAAAIVTLGGGETTIREVQLPETAKPHYLVVVAKKEPTDSRYPRRVGVPAKRPL